MNGQSVFLVVEDNEDDVFFLQRAFKDAGVKNPVHIVTNGQEAIDYLAGQNGYSNRAEFPDPDMVFLDLKMPGVDGFDVLWWIRMERKLRVPVAVLTSSPLDRDRQRARELGADCYLLKPLTPLALQSCCRQFKLSC